MKLTMKQIELYGMKRVDERTLTADAFFNFGVVFSALGILFKN